MIIKHPTLRLGSTAIAAVLALSSTPLSAQVADPLGPTADTAPVDPPVIAVPAVSAPVIEPATTIPTPDEVTVSSEPAPPVKAAKTKPVRTTTTRQIAPSASVATAPTVGSSTSATAPVDPIAEAGPTVDTPVPPPVVAEPLPAAAPVAEGYNSDLPLMAGGAGLAAIALLGTGIVASRRRRRRDEMVGEKIPAQQPTFKSRPAEPMPTTTPAADRSAFAWDRRPHMASATTHKLPSGFDISRFGRHVQAAYRGPTPDNPSLSLKRRLKRASFFDMKERQAQTGGGLSRTPELMPA